MGIRNVHACVGQHVPSLPVDSETSGASFNGGYTVNRVVAGADLCEAGGPRVDVVGESWGDACRVNAIAFDHRFAACMPAN